MSDPTPQSRDKVPSRFRSLLARKWQGKDIALVALALLFLSMSAYAFRAPIAAAMARLQAGAQDGETVSVFDVVLDRENQQYVDILFDRPLGEGRVGEILDPAPPRPSRSSAGHGSGRTPMPSGSSRAAAFRWPASTRSP